MDMNALKKVQYGMYIVSSAADGKMSGQISNTVFQTTSRTVQFGISISKQNFTCELIEKSGKFSVTALSEDAPFEFMGRFGFRSGRDNKQVRKDKLFAFIFGNTGRFGLCFGGIRSRYRKQT